MALVRVSRPRARFTLTGPDRVRFLHGMTTNDIEALTPGMGCRAAMLTAKGKTLAELVVYADPDRLFLELDAELRTKIHDVIHRHIVMDDVELADVTDDTRELGVYGEDARAQVEKALGRSFDVLAPYHFCHGGRRAGGRGAGAEHARLSPVRLPSRRRQAD